MTNPENDRLMKLLQAFGLLNSVMSIAEIEALKAEVFKELAIEVPEGEGIENLSPLSMIGSSLDEQQEV
jgi:hypothetical protein